MFRSLMTIIYILVDALLFQDIEIVNSQYSQYWNSQSKIERSYTQFALIHKNNVVPSYKNYLYKTVTYHFNY